MTHEELIAKQAERLNQQERLLAKNKELIDQAYLLGKREGSFRGYELGWQSRQVENSNRSMIKDSVTLTRIKELIEEYGANPGDFDSMKIARIAYNLSREDAEIADNMKDYWANLNAGSAR